MSSIKKIFEDIIAGKEQPVNDKNFDAAAYDPDADIDEIIAKSKIVVFGDVFHTSDPLRDQLAGYIAAHKPAVFVTEAIDESYQQKYDEMYPTGNVTWKGPADTAHISAIQNGSKLVFADPRPLDFKRDIVAAADKESDALDSKFYRVARHIFPEITIDREMENEQRVIDTFPVTDLAFTKAILENNKAQDGQVFVWVGNRHVQGIKEGLSTLCGPDKVDDQATYIDLFPLSQDAYDETQQYGLFRVNGRYVKPVLDNENGYNMSQFAEYLDTLPGHDSNQDFGSYFAMAYGHLDIKPDDYSADDLKTFRKTDFSP